MESHHPLSQFVYHPEMDDRYTRKEIRVIQYALCDYSVKETADQMHITQRAIYQHRVRIVEKSDVRSFEAVLPWLLLKRIFTVEGQVAHAHHNKRES